MSYNDNSGSNGGGGGGGGGLFSTTNCWTFLAGAVMLAFVFKKRSEDNITKLQLENQQLKNRLAQLQLQLQQQTPSSSNSDNSTSSTVITAANSDPISDLQVQFNLQSEKLEKVENQLKKQTNEWEKQRNELQKEIQRLQEENAKVQLKYSSLLQENQQFQVQLKLATSESEATIKDREAKLKEFQQKFEQTELQHTQAGKLSKDEAKQFKEAISKLEDNLKVYEHQLQEERAKFKELQLQLEKKEITKSESEESEDQITPRSDEEPPTYSKPLSDNESPPPYQQKQEDSEDIETLLPPPKTLTTVSVLNEDKPNDEEQHVTSEVDALKLALDLPDEVMDFVAKGNPKEPKEDEFDLSAFKKGSGKFGAVSKKSLRKGFDLSGLNEEFLQAENKTVAKNDVSEEELFAKLSRKSNTKKPAFLSVFGNSLEDQQQDIKLDLKPWVSGDPIVKGYAVREDLNSKGAKKTKKKAAFGFGSTSKGPEMEDQNYIEVPFSNDPTKALFCVFDGHGGKECALSAKAKFSTIFNSHLSNQTSSDDLSSALTKTFLELDSQLLEFDYMGCTATVMFVWQVGENRYLQAANVGDSTAFLQRANEVMWLTRDHKASSADERERIRASGAELTTGQTRVSGGLAVSRALGDHFLKQEKVGLIAEPYVSPSIKIETTDTVAILASDGLWDVMTGEEAAQIVAGLDSADAMARRLIQQALQNPKCTDNITVMVVVL